MLRQNINVGVGYLESWLRGTGCVPLYNLMEDAATAEISRNIQQAAQGTTQVASNISEVSGGAAKTGTGAADVLSSAKSLAEQSGRLKTEVDRFLATVRAA